MSWGSGSKVATHAWQEEMISRVDQSVDQLIMKGRVSKVIGGHRLSRTLESGFLFGASRTASVTNLHDLLFCMPQDMPKSIYNQPMMLTTEEREIPTRKMGWKNASKNSSPSRPVGHVARSQRRVVLAAVRLQTLMVMSQTLLVTSPRHVRWAMGNCPLKLIYIS